MDQKKSNNSFCNQWENFCDNVIWLRKQYGISKRRMAELMGVGIWTLNKIERGEVPPRADVSIFWNIHKRFGISPAEQLCGKLGEADKGTSRSQNWH